VKWSGDFLWLRGSCLGWRLLDGLCLVLGRELVLDLEGDGIEVHLIQHSSFAEKVPSACPRRCEDEGELYQHGLAIDTRDAEKHLWLMVDERHDGVIRR